MKKYIFILVALVAGMAVTNAQPNSKPKPKPKPEEKKEEKKKETTDTYILADFRDITWGSHIDSVYKDGAKVDFVKSTEYGGKNAYTISNDDMSIGTVVLRNIYYIFNDDDRFIGVIMIGTSKQFGEMKYILVNKFGQPHKEDETVSSKQFFWTIDDVRISLTNETINKLFTVDFTSDYAITESKRVNRDVDDF